MASPTTYTHYELNYIDSPLPAFDNTTDPVDWIDRFTSLESEISVMRIGNHLPDNVKANVQYGGFYLESKISTS